MNWIVKTKYGFISGLAGNEWTSSPTEAQRYCRSHAWSTASDFGLEGVQADIISLDEPETVCPGCVTNRKKGRGRKKKDDTKGV